MNASHESAGNRSGNHSKIKRLAAGMVGMGMIFDETYRPFFESVSRRPLYDPAFGVCNVELAAVASRTGGRAERYKKASGSAFTSHTEPDAVGKMLADTTLDFVCVATPDDRHFEAARAVLASGKHLLVEKPSVLTLAEVDILDRLAREQLVRGDLD